MSRLMSVSHTEAAVVTRTKRHKAEMAWAGGRRPRRVCRVCGGDVTFRDGLYIHKPGRRASVVVSR